jgi:hypothetical protein
VEHKKIYKDADGVRRTLITDEAKPGAFGVFTEQRLDEIFDSIARDKENHRERSVNKTLARIPVTVYERAVHEKWDEDDWRKFLNSDECKPFRIWQGRV